MIRRVSWYNWSPSQCGLTWWSVVSMRLCSRSHSVCNTANTLCSFARLSPTTCSLHASNHPSYLENSARYNVTLTCFPSVRKSVTVNDRERPVNGRYSALSYRIQQLCGQLRQSDKNLAQRIYMFHLISYPLVYCKICHIHCMLFSVLLDGVWLSRNKRITYFTYLCSFRQYMTYGYIPTD